MSKTLDTLIRQHNLEVKKLGLTRLCYESRAYAAHKEPPVEVLNKIDETRNLYDELGSDIAYLEKLEQSDANKDDLNSIQGYYEQNKIVSSHTYSKIISYYRKHKGKRYYSV